MLTILTTVITLSSMIAVTCLRPEISIHHNNYIHYQKRFHDKISSSSLSSSSMMDKCMTIKCPFFRRRAIDSVEFIISIMNFVLLTRHKSIPITFSSEIASFVGTVKRTNQTVNEIAFCILNDWQGKNPYGFDGKGYYITGALTKSIYRDDCYFDGPDPDMPVSGLQKYLLSVSNLFDRRKSRADITRPVVVNEADRTIQVFWRLEGVLNLPWHPHMKPWTGNTKYHIDSNGLVERHVEQWDISVLDAFLSTLLPGLGYGAPPAPPVRAFSEEFFRIHTLSREIT